MAAAGAPANLRQALASSPVSASRSALLGLGDAANAGVAVVPRGRRRGCGRSRCSAATDGKICAVCMIRGVRAAKRDPPWQDLRAMHSRKAICGAFRMHGAQILPMPARFGCMAAICCQGGALFPSEGAFEIHEARKLPRQGVRGRIARAFCHRRALGDASRRITTALPQNNAKGRIRGTPPTKTKEGERFARLLSLFSFTARVAWDL